MSNALNNSFAPRFEPIGPVLALRETLSRAGLNLFALLPTTSLPRAVSRFLRGHRPAGSLLLLGHGGRRLWRRIPAGRMRQRDPIDAYSIDCVTRALHRHLPHSRWHILYPGPRLIPLQKLGQAAGWAGDSPLGLGIHRRFGPWFAYRCAVWLDRSRPRIAAPARVSPCAACNSLACIGACPAAALADDRAPNVSACGRYRLLPESPCATRCLAREACPQGRAHIYTPDAMQYHYRHSLSVLRQWSGPDR